jgi:cobalt/nickel transport system permease protein
MFEWLTTDPLNGIIITITFFTSIIIGRYIRRKRTKSGNNGKFIDPRIKFFVLFILIISITLMKHWFVPIGISIICLLISLKLKIFQNYLRKLVFPALLAFFIIGIQGLTYGTSKINSGIIPVYSEGLEYGILIFARVLAAASLVILLLTSATENEILETMRWYRVPGTLLDISSLMSRYIKAFSTEAKKMKMAQESRCGFSKKSGFREKIHGVASITGALITRALIRAEQVYRAMLSRGWKHDSALEEHRKLDVKDLFMGFMLSTGIIILIAFDGVL